MPYSAGVHPTAMIWPVQKTGLPYNIVRFPNGPQKESASEVIARLDKLLERSSSEQQAAGRDRYIEAMLIEVLLILRQVSKADAQKVAGGEIRRLGLEPWSAELAQEREEQSHE